MYCNEPQRISIQFRKSFQSKSAIRFERITYDDIVVAAIALTALGAGPIFVPNVGAVWHIFSTNFRAQRLSGASFRNVKLFQCAQSKVRRTSPADLRQTDILTGLARFDRIQTFFWIFSLIRTNVAFHGSTWGRFIMRQSKLSNAKLMENLHVVKRIANKTVFKINFELSIVELLRYSRKNI